MIDGEGGFFRKTYMVNDEQLEAKIAALIREHSIGIEALTEKQMAEALKQAVLAGDFERNVRVTDGGQAVVYLPGLGMDRMRAEIVRLRELLTAHGIDYGEAE